MAEIFTSKGQRILVDDADLPLVSAYTWCIDSSTGYAVTNVHGECGKQKVYMHRLIMGLERGDKRMVDHRDMDRANNTRLNLRVCTKTENMRNRGQTRANKSGFKGVSWDSARSKWTARIKANGKVHCLGRFHDAAEAYAVYCDAAKAMHGEFVNLGVSNAVC
ncbi:HNH endonuclease [Burkholderia pseudomallei]|uniref:HNH endonuclease n=1 Tax=Burkholderia pseudomallei TaxID=28450 RepID=UPI0009762CF3|nr:HNH endonuclease [Burkholderia pseudomallei]CAJ2713266.1 pathogenesis-related transcriptional factor and ERF protein [Burkholderia pseudomallei]CAJ4672569.1 pathogenesis-related transcriptional factor and ERF protein [Burkholderia pseudomallei]VBM95023.1 pathogenesis-related transcriptional factor and ERF protein [Burkholderia pseudomallei]VBX79367.1 pathogenesis-related transcriptional factor and ERF protein [Burkholderia pseudomallei]VBX79394.1 pathogenesis-related transcriptional factor 